MLFYCVLPGGENMLFLNRFQPDVQVCVGNKIPTYSFGDLKAKIVERFEVVENVTGSDRLR